jgi:PPOX class probable F420-dependent enzyme
MLDTTTAAGRRAAERLQDEIIAWLVTVRGDGQPQPSPVWFLWQDPDILVYSRPEAAAQPGAESAGGAAP